jgi:parvulin-like peptidyl-prolyl cis-trans isomerase-like protein
MLRAVQASRSEPKASEGHWARPLVQFALLGAALFAADRLWWSRAAPEPLVIPAARVAAATEGLERALGRAPTPAEVERALAPEVEDELLYRAGIAHGYERDDPVVFRRLVQNLRFAGAPDTRDDASLFEEALALGLHETDPVARRRLVQRMRLDLEAGAPDAEPDEAALRAHYARHAAAYQSPARVRCTQLYFRGDRERAARALLAKLRADAALPERAQTLGDPFLYGAEQPLQTHDDLAGRFGTAFADGVFAAPSGAWSGPIPSSYGVHLVFVHEREEPRALGFDEVRAMLRHELVAERRTAALERGLYALRREVRVVLEPPPR